MKFLLLSFFMLLVLGACRKEAPKKHPVIKRTEQDQVNATTNPSNSSNQTVLGSVPTQTAVNPNTIPAGCNPKFADITQAQLISDGIYPFAKNQTIRYELSVLNCQDGSSEILNNLPIQFDLNSYFSSIHSSLRYSISNTEGLELARGLLNPKLGTDLFGNTGDYAYWTSLSLNYPTKIDKLILEVNLLDLEINSYDSNASSIDSYLRIGDALIVTKALPLLK